MSNKRARTGAAFVKGYANSSKVGLEYGEDQTVRNTRWELPMFTWIRNIFVELFATAFMTFLYLLPIETGSTLTGLAITRGFLFWGLMYPLAFLNIGYWFREDVGHMNPMVTMVFTCLGRTTWLQGLIYFFFSQPAGTALGALLVYAFSFAGGNYGTVHVGAGFTIHQAFGYELLGGFLYILVHTWTIWKYHFERDLNAEFHECFDQKCCWITFAPIAIGGIIAALSNAGYNISGALFNFWLYIWPSLYSGQITGTGIYIYLASNFIAGIVVVLFIFLLAWSIRRDYRRLCGTPCDSTPYYNRQAPPGFY